jgi:DNA-binding PadR family transcriptional regulator
VDVDLYLRVRQLFETKWDPAVLDLLAERPSRYLALVRRAQRMVGEQVADERIVEATITRTLQRLQQAGLVRADVIAQGRRRLAVYHLTDRGRQALDAYQAMLVAYTDAGGHGDDRR